jgi:Xaa-Pro dipeptidase
MTQSVTSHYQARLEKIWDWMAREEIALVMFEDTEGRRDASIRWLTGHPGDALFFLSQDRKSLLMPWDIILAKAYSRADFIIPYNDFDRSPIKAIRGVAEKFKIPPGSRIEISPNTPYPVFLDFVGELSDFDIICRNICAAAYAQDLRAVKDAEELAILKKAAGITNTLIDLLEKNVRSGKIKTEADAALFIELESRKRGAEGASFEILAAGPDRSFGIHAFPSWTNAPFGGQGLSILDFGLRYGGYCTDVTLTFAREASVQQQKMVNLVEKAAKLAVDMEVTGTESRALAIAVDDLFAKTKKRMPHGLGHGIGLDVHEYPFIRNRSGDSKKLEPGMVLTLEPGLYDPIHGGCRLENDILVTEAGNEILTEARIIWL